MPSHRIQIDLDGLIQPWLDTDILIQPTGATGRITEAFLARSDHGAGDVTTVSIRDATGGGGSGFDVTLGDGEASEHVTGQSLDVAASEAVYLRPTAVDASSMSLRGYVVFELTSGVATGFLTTLGRVKRFKGITSSADDTLLNEIIASVSRRMQNHMRRLIVSSAIAAEKKNGRGQLSLVLNEFPVITPPAVVVRDRDGDVVDTAEYAVETGGGRLLRVKDGVGGAWEWGAHNYEVDYTAGFATVPDDLAGAATEQVVYKFQQTQPGGDRLGDRGTVLDAAGSAQFLTGAWAPGVVDAMVPYVDRRYV